MSGSILGGAVAAGTQAVNVLIRAKRQIGTIIPDVVLTEQHHDELTITQHPVEMGAPISDHAFLQPSTLIMRAGWSNSRPAAFGIVPIGFMLQNQNFVVQVYQALLDLQAKREPFQIFTGKRFYINMLIASLDVETDVRTEYALAVTVRFQEVIIVRTSTTQVGAAAAQTQPSTTGGTQSTGPTNGQPVQPTTLQQTADKAGIGGGAGGTPIFTPGAPGGI